LVNRLCRAGFTVSAVHLTQFGSVRIRAQFGLDKPTDEDRRGIEAAYRRAPWLADARFTAAGTRPDFSLARSSEARAEFPVGDSQVIELGGLLSGLSRDGFPPRSMRVARMFAGVPFGFPIPGDVALVDAEGAKRLSGTLHRPRRPLVLVFFPL